MTKLCISIKEHHKSLFSLQLPTSGGYVDSSLLFLLKREVGVECTTVARSIRFQAMFAS